ncbi:UDP-N-acetylglucosamine--undecaprenyl-phosphate N-acetylglucosaminephosphotransferase [Enterobacteriaceae bacterium YMB-R22]|jgi:UDP-GlcNAc:undecaprenyl-phosphate GlcNAc-1-phosphate transferase|uniref:UDP-N-acetylglucosamine--undecaprenyl-phosphate N-acetylglucosaminephosphotransferase n=1 Tax=Tenebrionicola larvae TaxID=2815733 RepID=UPI002011DF37|nr:UDP-N-acetylglucosamine--undecaprenyl-phosphate N-acetylglucosaminephosphotransferase [Tenebrionicola larvae]MBV4413741.1 UDP-N-acetylglucosamine--undecaprenyl-phosphate N-acetylglucosaminephosphotransferase [Tenebrionicola larvae]
MPQLFTVFISALLALIITRYLAVKVGLVDKPGVRKLHQGDIPLVGGISIWFALVVFCLLQTQPFTWQACYLLCSGLLLIVGVLDDRFDLPVFPRVIVQLAVAALMMWAGFKLSSLGAILPGLLAMEGLPVYGITILAVWGAINAFNMIDGINGLLGLLSCVTFSALALLFYLGERRDMAFWCLGIIVATLPYLFSNLGLIGGARNRVFMGDAGSTVIGFTVIWLLIIATQGQNAVADPVTALWVIAIPLMDMARLFFSRMLSGNSPFKPDRDHLHHVLQHCGLTANQTLAAITLAALALALTGIGLDIAGVHESISFALFMVLFAIYFWFTGRYKHGSEKSERHSREKQV